jgi:hypothetical protein
MKIEEIVENVFNVNFDTQEKLASTFLRFQEHYESPEFKGKTFTLEEFKEWYTANSTKGKETGKFTYYEDWGGFNIPSHILKPFYEGSFEPLSKKEKKLLDTFKDKKDKKFYIIGTFSGKEREYLLKHETAHGLFYTNPDYRHEVLNELDKLDPKTRNNINKVLEKFGYNSDVWVDESHAYIMTQSNYLKKKGLDEDVTDTKNVLLDIFDKYFDANKKKSV